MKAISTDYNNREYAHQRLPVELYHIWRGSDHWRYTNGDVAVVYDTYTWNPATITRGTTQYDSQLEVNQLAVQFSRVTTPLTEFVSQNPLDVLWIEVLRLFRDDSPLEAGVVFIGQINSVAIQGVGMQLRCVGFEQFLKLSIPIYRYQPQCNWTLFDLDNESYNRCSLNKNNYIYQSTVNVSSDGLTLTRTGGDAWPGSSFFALGHIEWDNHSRMVVAQTSTTAVTLRYLIPGLTNGETIDLYPGCDGSIETCRDKFSNVNNFGGHPYIPEDNPATW